MSITKILYLAKIIDALLNLYPILISTLIVMYGVSFISTFFMIIFYFFIFMLFCNGCLFLFDTCRSICFNCKSKYNSSIGLNIFAMLSKFHYAILYLLLALNICHIPNLYVYTANAFFALCILCMIIFKPANA